MLPRLIPASLILELWLIPQLWTLDPVPQLFQLACSLRKLRLWRRPRAVSPQSADPSFPVLRPAQLARAPVPGRQDLRQPSPATLRGTRGPAAEFRNLRDDPFPPYVFPESNRPRSGLHRSPALAARLGFRLRSCSRWSCFQHSCLRLPAPGSQRQPQLQRPLQGQEARVQALSSQALPFLAALLAPLPLPSWLLRSVRQQLPPRRSDPSLQLTARYLQLLEPVHRVSRPRHSARLTRPA